MSSRFAAPCVIALSDPYNSGVTLEADFLHHRFLEAVITDTHFSKRSRLGRLIVFVVRCDREYPNNHVFRIGVDEDTALLVGSDGIGHIVDRSTGSAWLVMPQRPADVLVEGRPLTIKDLRIVRLDQRGSIDLTTRALTHPAAEIVDAIDHRVPLQDSMAFPIMMRSIVPPNEP